MAADFSNFSDDFFINMDLNTALPMPQGRETVLQFCEAAQKNFADMSDFYQRETGEYVLEGDRNAGSYRWLELGPRRLSSGSFNPASVEDCYQQHAWLLDRSRYFLGISHLDVESLDLIFGFNLDYVGNRDAVVCEALLEGSRLGTLLGYNEAVPLSFEPSLIVALDPECSMQARLAIETRNSSYQVRTGNYEEEPISVYLTVRAYPRPGERIELSKSLTRQSELGEDIVTRIIIPKFVRPIALAIAAAQ